MKLYGMLDSPFVRRVAISLQLLELPFDHVPLSVFSSTETFRLVSPVLKVPTLVCDDGTTIIESSQILTYAYALARPRTLLPAAPQALAIDLALTGLGLAALEKSVQLVYEDALRPAEKRHEPWVERVTGQLCAAYQEIEKLMNHLDGDVSSGSMQQAGVTVAVAWNFTQEMVPKVASGASCARLQAFTAAAEALPEFRAAPHGPGTLTR